MARPAHPHLRKVHTESTDGSLPAVLGGGRSAPRLKRALDDRAEAEEAIDSSLAAMLQLDDLELELPSRPEEMDSLVPELPATISLAPVAAESSAPRSTYRVLHRVGAGGMATVYDAIREGSDGFRKRVALKRIHDHLADNPRLVELLVDEARLASLIDHPNVCQVLDFGVDSSGHFMALEFLDGFTLRQVFDVLEEQPRLSSEPRHQLVVARVVAGLAEGLHAAHQLTDEAGQSLEVVHRDVTPHNLFVLANGGVKVTDFGVARAKNQLHQTATGAFKGKLAYSSPEQLHRKGVDRQTDVFALGVVMWEMLTGARLFEADSDAATIASICHDEIPDVRSRQSVVLPSLSSIVKKATAREKDQRFKSARELSRAIERALAVAGDPVTAVDVSEWLGSLMGSRIAPRRVDPNLATLAAESTHSVGTLELEAAPEGPQSASYDSAERSAPVFEAPAKPVVALVVSRPELPAAHSLQRRRWPAAVGGALAAIIAVIGFNYARSLWARSPSPTLAAAPKPVVAQAAPPTLQAPLRAPQPAAPAAAPAVVAKPAAVATPVVSAPAHASHALPATSSPKKPSEPKAEPQTARLEQFGSVLVSVSGGAANVLVDGRNFGPAPQRITLPVGPHTVALGLVDGSVAGATAVRVDAGSSSFITLPMVNPSR